MADPEMKTFDIIFEGTGTMSGKMRNDVKVHFETMNETYDLATDEGPFHGGDATAPPPLALFTAALTGCIMTQIRAFSKRMKIPIGQVTVNARLHWRGEQIRANDPYTTAPVGFDLDIDFDSSCEQGGPAAFDGSRQEGLLHRDHLDARARSGAQTSN